MMKSPGKSTMKPISYFWSKAAGLNADIARHREEEQKLLARLQQASAEGDAYRHGVYMRFLQLLRVSKARVLEQLGRKGR